MLIAKNTLISKLGSLTKLQGESKLGPITVCCPARTGRGRLVCGRPSPLQYWSTVSMALLRSEAQRMRAEPAILFSTGHQPCHRYTSW